MCESTPSNKIGPAFCCLITLIQFHSCCVCGNETKELFFRFVSEFARSSRFKAHEAAFLCDIYRSRSCCAVARSGCKHFSSIDTRAIRGHGVLRSAICARSDWNGRLPASGPQTASLFQGWRYSSPRIRVGVCRGHQRVCQPAYVNPQLACWRVCCVAFAR